MDIQPSIVWFRQDLRINDNPALYAALKKGGPLIPVFIWAPDEENEWPPGAATKWWLHHSLKSLQKDLVELGLSLIIRIGSSLDNLKQIAKSSQADAVYWNRRYEPAILKRDKEIMQDLKSCDFLVESFNGSLLIEPWEISSKQNTPYKVYTPYWNCCLTSGLISNPLPKPSNFVPLAKSLSSEKLENLELLPKFHWDSGLNDNWLPGEKPAMALLKKAIANTILNYAETRNRPDLDGVSHLSPYLHFGEISPRQIWHQVHSYFKDSLLGETFLKQIGWREFSYYLLYHFPHTPLNPLVTKFDNFPWKDNSDFLTAWKKGLTGYPLVDAGMRQLWFTGWMHNRVRMVVASFLVKDLMQPWQEGAKWFWDTLVDADLANNTMGWQWTAGCGADAAPYYRIFNPTAQGEKFDITREYVKKWVPELKNLSDKWIYKPFEAPADELRRAGITLGVNYPKPIVDHAKARLEALKAFQEL